MTMGGGRAAFVPWTPRKARNSLPDGATYEFLNHTDRQTMTIALNGNGQINPFELNKNDVHDMKEFHKENENKSAGDLLNLAENGHLERWQKAAIGQELQHRLDHGEIGKDCTPEEKKELQGLLDNMKKAICRRTAPNAWKPCCTPAPPPAMIPTAASTNDAMRGTLRPGLPAPHSS